MYRINIYAFHFPRLSTVLYVNTLTSPLPKAKRLKVSFITSLTVPWINTGLCIQFKCVVQWLITILSTDVSGLTGLRVRFTELGDVPHLPGRSLSRFYALKEMKVMGSCMCHGHANRCLPQGYSSHLLPSTIQVCMQGILPFHGPR